jgi:predicted short-subunit dehydrogenase-like oxidoreductase (DUF2520 family)
MKKMLRVTIAGSGGVAEALCRWIPASGHRVVQVFARNEARGRALGAMAGAGWTDDPAVLEPVDLFLIAVSDRAIGEVSRSFDPRGAAVAHTGGSCGLDELPAGAARGVFYPLQTFSPGRVPDLQKIPIFIEAENEETFRLLAALAADLSDSVHAGDSALRRKLHLAAVFVCNFVNDLYATGESLVKEAGLDFGVLQPLIEETSGKVLENPSPLPLQTGPAVREDRPTIEKHLRMLHDRPDLEEIYRLLTEHIVKMKKTHGKL